MAVNKVVINNETQLDLTADTVSADKLSKGITAHNMAGEPIVGTMEAGGGGTNYTFTDGLTETDGTVSLDLFSKRLKPYNNSVSMINNFSYLTILAIYCFFPPLTTRSTTTLHSTNNNITTLIMSSNTFRESIRTNSIRS